MKEVYLYFRTVAAIGDDDAAGDSAMYPLSSLKGMVPSADDTLDLYFTPAIAVMADGQDGAVVNNDKIVVTLSSNNTHKDVITRLSRLFAGAASAPSMVSLRVTSCQFFSFSGSFTSVW